jgi:hypothetical protein
MAVMRVVMGVVGLDLVFARSCGLLKVGELGRWRLGLRAAALRLIVGNCLRWRLLVEAARLRVPGRGLLIVWQRLVSARGGLIARCQLLGAARGLLGCVVAARLRITARGLLVIR